MNNYIKADIHRVSKKRSFLFTLLGFLILFILMIFILTNPQFNETAYLSKTNTFLNFFPLVIGLSIFLSIYYDDFKSKAMQVAIGYGISRNKVILTKFIDTIILSLLSGIIWIVIVLITPSAIGLTLTAKQILDLSLSVLVEILRTIGYASISSVFVYYSQNAVIGIIAYVLLSSRTVMIILSTLLGQEFIVNTIGDLTQYLLTIILYSQKANFLQTGNVGFIVLPALIIYLVLPIIISMLLFRKKELEF